MYDYKKYLVEPIRKDRKPLQELLPLSQPLRVLIDPCDICNFKCEFCFQSKECFKGKKMSQETFDIVIKQLKEFPEPINIIHMYGLGEPMLNEKLPLFIKRIKEENVAKEVAITSNGSLLTHDFSRKIIEAGTDRLSISLNGISDSGFWKNAKAKVSFEKIYNEISYFYSIRSNCHLHVKINGEEYSELEKEQFVILFKDIADTINIDHIVNVWPDVEVIENKANIRMYENNQIELKKDLDYKSVCPIMFYELVIHPDGSVSPCAVDYKYKSQNLGNVYNDTLSNIWNGKLLNNIRISNLEEKNSEYKICDDCTYADCAATVNITPYRKLLLERFKKCK